MFLLGVSGHGILLIGMEAGEAEGVVSEWLDVPMFFSCFDPETMMRVIEEAGFEIVEAATENQLEQGTETPGARATCHMRHFEVPREIPPDLQCRRDFSSKTRRNDKRRSLLVTLTDNFLVDPETPYHLEIICYAT
jgi:hypothetical protein